MPDGLSWRHITISREPGADCEDVYRPITIFADGCGTEALLAGVPVRSSYFSALAPGEIPGPIRSLPRAGIGLTAA